MAITTSNSKAELHTSLKEIHGLLKISEEAFDCLLVGEAGQLAESTLSCEVLGNNTQQCVETFAQLVGRVKRVEFLKICKEQGIDEARAQFFTKCFQSIQILYNSNLSKKLISEVMDGSRKPSLHHFGEVFIFVKKQMQNLFVLFQPIFTYERSLADFATLSMNAKQKILPSAKQITRPIHRKIPVSYDHAEYVYDIIPRLFKQLTFYMKGILLIKEASANLAIDRISETDSFLSYYRNYTANAYSIAQKIIQIAAKFETSLSLRNGIEVKSPQAREYVKKWILLNDQLDCAGYAALSKELFTWATSQSKEQVKNNGEIPKSQFTYWQGLLSQIGAGKITELPKQTSVIGSPLFNDCMSHLAAKCIEVYQGCRKKYFEFHEELSHSSSVATLQMQGFKCNLSLPFTYWGKAVDQNNNLFHFIPIIQQLVNLFLLTVKGITEQLNNSEREKKAYQTSLQEKRQEIRLEYKEIEKLDTLNEINKFAHLISVTEGITTALHLFAKCTHDFSAIHTRIKKWNNTAGQEIADHWFEVIDCEESANEQKAFAASEKARKAKQTKEKDAACAASLSPVTTKESLPSTTPTQIPEPTSTLQSPLAKAAFELRHHFAKDYGINPAQLVVPHEIVDRILTPHAQSAYNELYAFDFMICSIEMLSKVSTQALQHVARKFFLLGGYWAIEQMATAEFQQKFPTQHLLHHRLSYRLGYLLHGTPAHHERWIKHADRFSLMFRYVGNATKKNADAFSFISDKQFCERIALWTQDVMSIKITLIAQRQLIQAPLKTLMESIVTCSLAPEHPSTKSDEGLTKDNFQYIEIWKKQLQVPSQHIQKLINSQPLDSDLWTALTNIQGNLELLQSTLSLFQTLPEQRFLYIYLHVMLIATQHFAKNLGTYLSIKQEHPCFTSSLKTYMDHYGLGKELKEKEMETLQILDVEQQSCYLYAPTANDNPLIEGIFELYARAWESILMGEGAIPAGLPAKSIAALQQKIMHWSQRFVKLAIALARSLD